MKHSHIAFLCFLLGHIRYCIKVLDTVIINREHRLKVHVFITGVSLGMLYKAKLQPFKSLTAYSIIFRKRERDHINICV